MTFHNNGMEVKYIYHSGFSAETEERAFVFDYYRSGFPDFDPEKPLYVFASHYHRDHFNPRIFALTEKYSDVTYIFGSDIKEQYKLPSEKNIVFLDPDDEWTDGRGVSVRTLRSNDSGVAFIVNSIYHAGDLNNWHWDEEPDSLELIEAYHEEMKKIRGMHFEIAFIPLDPRLEGHESEGIIDFMKEADADRIFPMHMWEDYDVIDRFLASPEGEALKDRIVPKSFYLK